MTTEEAICILAPETRREAMAVVTWSRKISTDQEACRLAVAALRAQQERENPQPLTWKELLARKGEPVWVVDLQTGARYWAIVIGKSVTADGNIVAHLASTHYAEEDYDLDRDMTYGQTWLAYDHKTKEGAAT